MSRGGARLGAGRKKGKPNRLKLQLEIAAESVGQKLTPAQRHAALKRQVAICVSDGMPPEKIAVIMGMTIDQLRGAFSRELEHGRELTRAAELFRLDAASAEGKVAASKIILQTAGTEKTAQATAASPKSNGRDQGFDQARIISIATRRAK